MGNNGSLRLPIYSIPMPLRSLQSFCSVREISRKTNTPYLGTEGGFYSIFGNRGSVTIWREQRKLEIWTCQWEGVSPMHACMQHATLTRTHGRTQHSRTHAAHSTRRNTHAHAQVLNLLPTSVKDCTFRDLHIDQGIINAQKYQTYVCMRPLREED